MKPVRFLGDSLDRIRAFPTTVRLEVGFQIETLQRGGQPGDFTAMSKLKSYTSVWDAIADTPSDSANLRMRSELMRFISGVISSGGWTQAEAARRCNVSQPRINDLLRGRISRFSLDALVNMATTLGWKLSLRMKAA